MTLYTDNSDDDSEGTPMGSDDECIGPRDDCTERKPCCRGCKRRECEEEDEG